MGKLIYVLHERSTKEHFIALENYALKNDVKIIYREFLILRYLLKSIWKLDVQLFIQQVKNISFFISMFLCKNKNIIIGIAPLDFYLPILSFFLRKHNLFYFTSWGDWSGDFYPKKKFSNSAFIKKSWSSFLKKDIKGIFSVTDSSAISLKENFELTCPITFVGHSIDNSIQINNSIISKRDINKINLIYVGRLVESKGVKELLMLMKNLDKEIYSLKIIGDGPLINQIEDVLEEFYNIEYLGFISSKEDLFKLYLQSDVQLLFSKKENNWEELFGMVIIEAMYCGVPTVSTSHVGPKSIIEHGVNGFLIDENNIINETIKILNDRPFKNQKIIEKTQTKAQQFYKDNLSKKWGEILDNYV
jgi:glycosyltransferase involved in cell wall biosynthesis|tara:strand:- start:409 stop:1491 length:1083 start_codon:yes stop_codon:yes gene_type:complete